MSLPAKNQKNNFLGLPYIRFLTEQLDPIEIEKLKNDYGYIFIYSYVPTELPGFRIKIQRSLIIDLSKSPEEIFKNFKKNTRNEIRKTEKIEGLEFKNLDKDSKKSYRFYKKIKKMDGVKPDIKKEFEGCLFFNAYFNNKIAVSVSVYDNGEILRLKHIVSCRKEKNFDNRISGYATRRIIWEICRYGIKNHYKFLDLAGATKEGITQFKQSFGGEEKNVYICRYETKFFLQIKRIINFLGKNIN